MPTYRLHQLLLTTLRDSYTTSTLAPAEDRVLRTPESGLGRVRVGHLDICMAKRLAFSVEQNMYTLNRVLQPGGNRRWGDILYQYNMSGRSIYWTAVHTHGTLSIRSTTLSSAPRRADTGVDDPCARSMTKSSYSGSPLLPCAEPASYKPCNRLLSLVEPMDAPMDARFAAPAVVRPLPNPEEGGDLCN